MKSKTRLVMAILALTLATAQVAAACGGKELKLKAIMVELGESMSRIVEAISTDDFEAVEANALLIAEHERPPMEERKKIIGFLGDDAASFRSFDETVHAEAMKMNDAAKEMEMEAVVESFSRVLEGCTGCHRDFKARVKEHFYK